MSHPLRRAVLVLAALTLWLPGCGKNHDDDDRPAAAPPTPAQPPAPAVVTADPVEPTPTAQPSTPTPAPTARPASSGTKPKSQPSANNNSPIPSALVPKQLQPLVPKIPANVLP